MRMAELKSQVTFRVSDEVYDRLNEIAQDERRKQNEVARALLERGIAAYERDGQLFEPNGIQSNGTNTKPQGVNNQHPDTIVVRKRQGGRSSQPSRKTGNG